MLKKECTDIRNNFSEYLDELLPERGMAELETHIKNCASCAKELEEFNKTVQAVRNLPRYSPHVNIIAKINDRIEKNKKWWQKLNTRTVKGTAGALAAILICVLGLHLYNNSNLSGLLPSRKADSRTAGTEKDISKDKKEVLQKSAPDSLRVLDQSRPQGKTKDAEKIEAVSRKTETEMKKQDGLAWQKAIQSKEQPAVKAKKDSKNMAEAFPAADKPVKRPAPLQFLGGIAANTFEQKGLFCSNSIKQNMVIREDAELQKLWKKSFAGLPEPVIDFNKEMLIAVFLGEQDTEPKDVTIKEMILEDNKIKIKIGITAILDTDTSGKKLSPYHIKAVKKSALAIEFKEV